MQGPIAVLLLEDSDLDVELEVAHLRKTGLPVMPTRVDDRESFERALTDSRPDLILADYNLPQFDGLTALDIAQQVCPDVPFLFVSGAMGEDIAIESLKRGATDYVLKQKLERLGPAVQRALEEARERNRRKEAQEETAKQARELASLNADLQQFAYAASHDLREPLRTISVFSRMLAERYENQLDSEAHEYLNFIESAAQHMSALLHDLLIYTRIPADQRKAEAVDLNQVLKNILFVFRTAIQENNGSITSDDLPTVRGHQVQLSLVLQNLISNALKYKGEEPPQIHVSAHRREDEWLISVQDNGIGFDQLYAERVFELFKRLRTRDYPGSGLGLAICKRIVELHGGRIWALSEPDRGSVFSFTLPANPSEASKNGRRECGATPASSGFGGRLTTEPQNSKQILINDRNWSRSSGLRI
jgi:signal transduction histidine kinase